MTVRELINYLQENYSEDQEIFIDESTDGGFSGERELYEGDIHPWGENQIIISWMW